MSRFLLRILFLSIFGFQLMNAYGEVSSKTTQIKVRDSLGKEISIAITSYKNQHNELEVRLEAIGFPKFTSQIKSLLGYGRDFDGNGKIDAWFLLTKNGVDLQRIEGSDSLGLDILGNMLNEKHRTTFSMYTTTAATSLLSYLFLSVNAGLDTQEEFYRDWMDLEEARIAFEEDFNELGSSYTYAQLQYHNEIISTGFKELANRMDKFSKQSFWGYTFADIGLWITGGVVINWGAKILTKLGVVVSETAFVTTLKETLIGFFEKQKALVESRVSLFKEKIQKTKSNMGMKVAQKEVTTALSVTIWKKAVVNTIKAMKVKKKLRVFITKSLKVPKKFAQGVQSEWKYIVMNSSVQIGSEAVARYDQIYDENPAVMVRNLLENPDVIQNVGFMTTETIMMTGISKNLKTVKARFAASGAVALTNSSVLNFAIKDEANINRVILDSAWETIVGNAQVQFDLKALEYFEKMAATKKNPKIKFLGYVVALVDMGAGYWTYSKATTLVEKDKNESKDPKVMLVPAFAEE